MIISNVLVNGCVKSITVENGVITDIADGIDVSGKDMNGLNVFAGLIDVHTHGCVGYDTMDADFEKMCAFYAEHGTTSFLPTTMTMDYESLKRVTDAKTEFSGANILGIHLEGPYISKKYKGAQNEAYIRNPDIEEFCKFDNVAMITVAPELEGSENFIKEASKKCVVSIGHTDCDYETAIRAIECGANCLTHTFNAMPPLLHRDSGPIGAGFEKHIYAQIICDGLHISKPAILAAYRLFGPDRLTLISDSIRPAGLKDGIYESGGLEVHLKNGEIRLADGTLAGSGATLFDCVKKAIKFGIPREDAFRMASQTPAEMLGVNKGRVEVGYDADLIFIDDNLNLTNVMINGQWVK